jgi:exodeoxyribonuclease V alpha subunit
VTHYLRYNKQNNIETEKEIHVKRITITRVRFTRDDFAIVDAKDEKGHIDAYKGTLPNADVGEVYNVDCYLSEHQTYGKQYIIKSTSVVDVTKPNPNNILQYMQSGAIKGCGPATAQKIYEQFGDDSLRIIREDWHKLEDVKGISEKIAEKIHNGETSVSKVSGLLGMPGITPSKAKKLYDVYKEDAEKVVKEEPYRIMYDIKGFAFKTVDNIALRNGISCEAPQRIAGALTFLLVELSKEGHCYCGKKKLLDQAEELLAVRRELIETELANEVTRGNIIIEGRSVYAKRVYETECETAQWVAEKVNTPALFTAQQVEAAMKQIQNLNIADEQREAVIGALTHNIFAITGGAGTGKTTVIKTIAQTYRWLCRGRVVMCAPTGKAARRMTEATGFEAMTSARLSLIKSEWPLNSLIICDEASMLDIKMARDLMLVAHNGHNQIIFIGDVNQLPPIGAGTFFRDMLASEIIPAKKLLICHRQSGVIAENADKINKGEGLSKLIFDNVHTKYLAGTDVQSAVAAYKNAVSKYGVANVCLLLPFRTARGDVPATESANMILRPVYNSNKPEYGCRFAKGDRVINLVNDPEMNIANGDVGTVIRSSKTDNCFVIQMDSGVQVEYTHEHENQFDLAYALTIHKSQGSEYDCVIILLTSAAFIMLERNLVYTAVTRGKKEVIMMGEKKAYGMAIHTQKAIKRNTKLIERMRALI